MARLRKRSPLSELMDIEDRMEEMFTSSFPGVLGRGGRRGGNGERLRSSRWVPEVDIYEQNDQLIVECECPGMKRDDLNVSVDDSTLTITGNREREETIEKENYYRSERAFDSFERSFRLPTEINADQVNAVYQEGILRITLPVTESQKKREIRVK